MFLSRGTVQTYISRILTKLGAKGRVEIVREALRHGVSPQPAHQPPPLRQECRHMTTIHSPAQLIRLACARLRAQAKPQDGTCTG
jgi:hypothetical protein